MQQHLEQEIKELQTGLGAVVQALNFLQSFLESDYGLKFQFHAYCNSPLYSHNSSALEALKQKYGNVNGSGFGNNARVYHQQQSQSQTGPGDPQLVHVRFQSNEGGLEPTTVNVISGCTVGSCNPQPQTLAQTYVTVSNPGELSTTTQHSSTENVSDPLNPSQRTPIIVNDDDIHIFGISELTSMKEESQEMYRQNDTEMDAFEKHDFEENSESNDDEISNIRSPDVNVVSKKLTDETNISSETTKRGRTKKEKISDGYKCPHCRRRCADRLKLELHMSHHKQQFQCSECGIWLADKSVLNRHMRVHTGDRPFSCEFCKETFTRQDIVKKHILRKHKDMIGNTSFLTGVKYSKSPAPISNN